MTTVSRTKTLTYYVCDDCKHEWIPRKLKLPAVCPVCKHKVKN